MEIIDVIISSDYIRIEKEWPENMQITIWGKSHVPLLESNQLH